MGASERDGPLNAGNPLLPPLVSSKQTNGLRRFKQAASHVPTSFSVPSAFPARGSASPSAQPLCLPYLPTLPPPSAAPPARLRPPSSFLPSHSFVIILISVVREISPNETTRLIERSRFPTSGRRPAPHFTQHSAHLVYRQSITGLPDFSST